MKKEKTPPQLGQGGTIAADNEEARKSLRLPSQFVYLPMQVLDPPEPISRRKRPKK